MRTRFAAAVALGYFLGRTKKMKLAITIGGLLAGRRLSTDPKQLLQQGAKLVSSPELSKVTETVRGRLGDAVKEAATAAVSNRIDSLGDSLTERAAKLRGTTGEESEQEPESEAESGTERRRAQETPSRAEEKPRGHSEGRPRPRSEHAPRSSPRDARPRSRPGGDDD